MISGIRSRLETFKIVSRYSQIIALKEIWQGGTSLRKSPWPKWPCLIWQYRLWSFQERDTKLERLLAKKSIAVQWNYQIWRIGVVASCQNLTFKVNFLRKKSSASFLFFFVHWRMRAHFLLLTFFDNINF